MKNASNGNALQEQKLLVTKLQKELIHVNGRGVVAESHTCRVSRIKSDAQLANVESGALATLADKERIERDLNVILKDLEAERVRY